MRNEVVWFELLTTSDVYFYLFSYFCAKFFLLSTSHTFFFIVSTYKYCSFWFFKKIMIYQCLGSSTVFLQPVFLQLRVSGATILDMGADCDFLKNHSSSPLHMHKMAWHCVTGPEAAFIWLGACLSACYSLLGENWDSGRGYLAEKVPNPCKNCWKYWGWGWGVE